MLTGGGSMDLVLSFLTGIIISIMMVFNGQLSDKTGVYLSTVIIHLVGLVTFVIIMKIKKEKISFKNQISLFLYTGGMIGVLTVIFNVVSINGIGAALSTTLGLLGQMITSVLLEYTGWLSTEKRKLTIKKVISLIVVSIGIGVMMI